MAEIEKLNEVIKEAESLMSMRAQSSSTEFRSWRRKAKKLLIDKYGENSFGVIEFDKIQYLPQCYSADESDSFFIAACQKGLKETIDLLEEFRSDFSEFSSSESHTLKANNYKKVFIVHGHSRELREGVARLVDKQKIEPIILDEQANKGKTIIEKLEKYGDVAGAICLFTADDLIKAKDEAEECFRARQNVVLEAGYFIGSLGREKVIILADDNVELPSDLDGVVYAHLDNWQLEILQELKAIGYSIDLNRLV